MSGMTGTAVNMFSFHTSCHTLSPVTPAVSTDTRIVLRAQRYGVGRQCRA